MNLSSISAADFRRLTTLIETKESLLSKIAEIDAELSNFGNGHSPSPTTNARVKAPKASRKGAKRGIRGQLKETIIGLLKSAGKSGLKVKDIATTTGAKPQSVHVWFSSTGKKTKEIKKLAPGHFVWVG